MRWILVGLVAFTIGSIGVVVSAQGSRPPKVCTQVGTSVRDIMAGTRGQDVLCALRGPDYLHGDGGRDVLKAGAGPDVLIGGGGRDQLRGQGGNDRIFAVDQRGGERIIGGAGNDQCFADRGDRVSGCEATFRGLSIQVVRSLSRTALNLMVIADEAATVTETIIIGPGTIITHPPLPECTPPPASPPPNC